MIITNKGFGLSEVLISLFLASLIMSALINHYLCTKKQYQHIESHLEQAYELQLVTNLLRNSIYRAGFTPCMSINHLTTVDRRNGHNNLRGLESPNPSELIINHMSEQFDTLIGIINKDALSIPRTFIPENHPIIIADCNHAEVQKIIKVDQFSNYQIVKLAKPLAFDYQPPIYIGEWLEERYFIRSKNPNKPTLFYHQKHTDELSAYIQSMAVNIMNNHKNTLVSIQLGLDQKNLVIAAMVRAS